MRTCKVVLLLYYRAEKCDGLLQNPPGPSGGILISIQGLGLHSQTQKNLYKEGVEQHGLNKVFQGDYRELTEALQQEIQARKESVAAHAEEIAAFDMKINYLRVRTEDLRQ